MMKSIVVIGTVVLLSAPVAIAKERSFGACAADIKAKCADVKPGGGRIKDCVKTHAADFSDACRQGLRGSPRSAKPAQLT
jgi:hypothetical protein